ncbi:hypothetical protein CUMW_206570 [Citrus unshiu]|nr:hypothetical protein CUMW_206570 [Citrus unshiu]
METTLNFFMYQLDMNYELGSCAFVSKQLRKLDSLMLRSMICYCRLTYMPMSYLYGKRFVGPITPLILQLREEIYTQPYNEINWSKLRHYCAKVWLI